MAIAKTIAITGTSPAAPGTAVLTPASGPAEVRGLSNCDSLLIDAALVGATGGTLNVYVQRTIDNGVTWRDYVAFPQLAAGAAAIVHSAAPARLANQIPVGSNAAPALAAGSIAGGHWGDALRVVCVAGASTTAGALLTITFYGVEKRS